jgi:galactokinase
VAPESTAASPGAPSGVASASAPGRVNLIGEHTDYNGGFVLPVAAPLRTRAAAAPRADRRVRAWSRTMQEVECGSRIEDWEEYELGGERPGRGWVDYVQGATAALLAEGAPLRGFDVAIDSSVPVGAGLASSAALVVALLRALREAFQLAIDDPALALMAQRVENEFVGAHVGVMDPMAALFADERAALLIDARSREYDRIPMPEAAELLVLHSGAAHDHARGEYNRRRAECEQAAALLGVPLLRECTAADLPRVDQLPPPLNRRARHVVTENARVLEAAEALRAGDLPALGRLFGESHASLRDDYDASAPALDCVVEAAAGDAAVYGARATGGGFGGAVVALTAERGLRGARMLLP